MTYKPLPSIDVLRQLLEYEPETGLLVWLARGHSHSKDWKRFNARFAGKEALGSVASDGYKVGSLLNIKYSAHRIAWAMATEVDPAGMCVDHINHNRGDNRIGNLRLANKSQNQWNKVKNRNALSKFKGVSFDKRQRRWVSMIYSGGKNIYLGSFDSEASAALMYDKMAAEMFGRYAATNEKLGLLICK